jgi:hypothetical protein
VLSYYFKVASKSTGAAALVMVYVILSPAAIEPPDIIDTSCGVELTFRVVTLPVKVTAVPFIFMAIVQVPDAVAKPRI